MKMALNPKVTFQSFQKNPPQLSKAIELFTALNQKHQDLVLSFLTRCLPESFHAQAFKRRIWQHLLQPQVGPDKNLLRELAAYEMLLVQVLTYFQYAFPCSEISAQR